MIFRELINGGFGILVSVGVVWRMLLSVVVLKCRKIPEGGV